MMKRPVQIESLQPDQDAKLIKEWLYTYLHQHIQWWSHAAKLAWSSEYIERHIQKQGLVERDWEEICKADVDPMGFVTTARQQDQVVGIAYGTLGQDRYLKLPTGSISWVYVSEKVRGKGVAQSLLRPIHDWMYDRGVMLREVHVTEANPSAVHLYKACGYRIVDHRMLS